MKRTLFYLIAFVGALGLGWWAWGLQRSTIPALEIAAPGALRAATRLPADDPDARSVPVVPGSRPLDGGASRGAIGVEAARAELVSLAVTISALGTLRAAESVGLKPDAVRRVTTLVLEGG